jgi:hypothetical protein
MLKLFKVILSSADAATPIFLGERLGIHFLNEVPPIGGFFR